MNPKTTPPTRPKRPRIGPPNTWDDDDWAVVAHACGLLFGLAVAAVAAIAATAAVVVAALRLAR